MNDIAYKQILAYLASPRPRNFVLGASLYEKYGANLFLKRRFANDNKYNRDLLLQSLQEIASDYEKQLKHKRKKTKINVSDEKLPAKQKLEVKNPSFPGKIASKKGDKPNFDSEFYQIADKVGFSEVDFAILPFELKEILKENYVLKVTAEKEFEKLRTRNAFKQNEDLSEEDIAQNALQCKIIVESMKINAMGWAEVRNWQKNKRFLKLHPYFKKKELEKSIKDLSLAELRLLLKNRQSNVLFYKKKMQKDLENKDFKKAESRQAKIDDWNIDIETMKELVAVKSKQKTK